MESMITFLSTRVSNFAHKKLQPNAYQVKFSRKLPGKMVRRQRHRTLVYCSAHHIISSSVHKPYPCMLAVA